MIGPLWSSFLVGQPTDGGNGQSGTSPAGLSLQEDASGPSKLHLKMKSCWSKHPDLNNSSEGNSTQMLQIQNEPPSGEFRKQNASRTEPDPPERRGPQTPQRAEAFVDEKDRFHRPAGHHLSTRA